MNPLDAARELADRDVPAGLLREVGVRGAAKSLYHSLRHAGGPLALVCGRRSSVAISDRASVSIPRVLFLGAYNTPNASQACGGARLQVDGSGTLRVTASDFAMVGAGSLVHVGEDATLELGDSYLNGRAHVSCADRVTIGDDCAVAWDVTVLDNDGGHDLSVDGERRPRSAPVTIEDEVWVGHDAAIHKGVTVGAGAVVAAHSVVTSDVPAGSLVGGVPARVLSTDASWSA